MAMATLGSGAMVGDTVRECCTSVMMNTTELEAEKGVGGREISSRTKHMALVQCITPRVRHHQQQLVLLQSTLRAN